jgi:hypothetical protein
MALITRQAQLAGQAALLRFSKLNPLGTNLAIGPLVTLLALSYGASDFQTGLMYASMNLCGAVALVTPVLCGGLDASRVFFGAWFVRGALGAAYLALPLLPGNQAKIWLLILVYFGFMAARSIGFNSSQVVTKAVCRPGELGEIVSLQLTWWYIGTIAGSLLTALVLNRAAWFPSPEWAFLSLLALGVVFNFATSMTLRRLPPTGAVARSSALALLGVIPSVLRDPERREVILLALCTIPMGIAAGYQLNYLKVVLNLSSDVVFMTTIGGMVAMLLGSHLSGIVGRSIGFRPLQFGAHAFLAFFGIVMAWAGMLPAPLQPAAAIAVYILASLCISVSGTVFTALTIDRLGETHRHETSIIFQLGTTLAAGLGLGLIALAKKAGGAGIPGGHAYSHSCLVWSVCSLAVCLASLRLRRPGDTAWGDLAMLHPYNLLSAVRLHQVDKSKDSIIERMLNLENVLTSGTAVSRARMLQFLNSPDTAHRLSAYRSLCINPLPESAPTVLQEALNTASPLRIPAITALGFINDRSVLPALRPLLKDPSPRISAAACKTLLRLGEHWTDAEVLAHWREQPEPGDRMEILIGLAATRRIDTLWEVIRVELSSGSTGSALRVVLLHLADALGERAEICEIWSAEDKTPGAGQAFVLGELGEKPAFADLADPGPDRDLWRERVAARLKCPRIPDDCTAVSLLFLAGSAQARKLE